MPHIRISRQTAKHLEPSLLAKEFFLSFESFRPSGGAPPQLFTLAFCSQPLISADTCCLPTSIHLILLVDFSGDQTFGGVPPIFLELAIDPALIYPVFLRFSLASNNMNFLLNLRFQSTMNSFEEGSNYS